MNARMVTLTARPGHLFAITDFYDEQVVTEITAQRGNRGFFLLANAQDDTATAVSLWDSAEDADATAPTLRRHMTALADHLAGPPRPAPVTVAAAAVASLIG
jgi:hypothetical protein